MNTLKYKLLELRFILNRELYENNLIDINLYNKEENILLNKLRKE